jgi:hypothetical protein
VVDLLRGAALHPDMRVKRAVVQALGGVSRAERTPVLMSLLATKDSQLFAAVLNMLTRERNPRVTRALFDRIAMPDFADLAEVNQRALLNALLETAEEDLIEPLQQLLTHGSWLSRPSLAGLGAARTLRRIGTDQAIAVLEAGLRSRNETISAHASMRSARGGPCDARERVPRAQARRARRAPARPALSRPGRKLLQRLNTMFKVARTYKVGNSVFGPAGRGLPQPDPARLRGRGGAGAGAARHRHVSERLPAPDPPHERALPERGDDEFEKRKISAIRLTRGLEGPEIEKFFELVHAVEVYVGQALLDACLAAGNKHFLPAIHVSTDAQDSDFLTGTPGPTPSQPRSRRGGDEEAAAGSGALPEAQTRGKTRAPSGRCARATAPPCSARARCSPPHRSTTTWSSSTRSAWCSRWWTARSRKEPVVVGLTTLGHHDEYTYAHAVNARWWRSPMAHFLGLDRRALADIGVAALFHDVGKSAVST